jgi:hypothetical protein
MRRLPRLVRLRRHSRRHARRCLSVLFCVGGWLDFAKRWRISGHQLQLPTCDIELIDPCMMECDVCGGANRLHHCAELGGDRSNVGQLGFPVVEPTALSH